MIHINDYSENPAVDEKTLTRLEEFGNLVLGDFHCQKQEVGLILVDNRQIKEYNLQYRGRDEATDVLSFAMNEGGEEPDFTSLEQQPQLLGDIFISVEKAVEQAEDYGHSFTREIFYLMIHGMLHLMGYDHQTEEEKKIMRGKEEELLNKFIKELTD